MKNKLFPQIYDLKALWRAWNRIKRKGSTGGIDRISVETFERRLEHNLKEISQSLQREVYVPEPTKRLYIPKSNPYERRKIAIPVIRDKIVQAAVRTAIEPLFDSIFLDSSYAYRPNKEKDDSAGDNKFTGKFSGKIFGRKEKIPSLHR